MDLDDQFDLEHLFLKERICRVCGEEKNLIDGFYLTRNCLLYTSDAADD